jgi:hypothetical protein
MWLATAVELADLPLFNLQSGPAIPTTCRPSRIHAKEGKVLKGNRFRICQAPETRWFALQNAQ